MKIRKSKMAAKIATGRSALFVWLTKCFALLWFRNVMIQCYKWAMSCFRGVRLISFIYHEINLSFISVLFFIPVFFPHSFLACGKVNIGIQTTPVSINLSPSQKVSEHSWIFARKRPMEVNRLISLVSYHQIRHNYIA